MGYNAEKYSYLDSHGTTVRTQAGVTYLQSSDLKHLVPGVLQADALKRSSWCDCGNGGCPRCNLDATIVIMKCCTEANTEERGIHIVQFCCKMEVQYAIDCATCPR